MRGNWILFNVYKKCTKDKEKCKIFSESIYKKTFYSNIRLKYSVKIFGKTADHREMTQKNTGNSVTGVSCSFMVRRCFSL